MQTPSLQLCKTITTHHQLGFHHTFTSTQNLFPSLSFACDSPKASSRKLIAQAHKPHQNAGPKGRVEVKGKKDNVWSIDNELAKASPEKGKGRADRRRPKGRKMVKRKRSKGGQVMVSGAMLMEVETVLQTQEPVIRPAWNTFSSSVSGIWKGVGAVFSPITAEMEPIEIGNRNENLYDCYTLSHIQAVPSPSGGQTSQIQRRTNWVTLNPYGEIPHHVERSEESENDDTPITIKRKASESARDRVLPTFESFDFERSDVMEDDVMGCELGLVFFEDGSYSRGPVDIPVGEVDDTNYYLNPTLKFEQCLVKGCHKRLRIVHTIEFSNGGADIQIMRVAVYEEQWDSPASLHEQSGLEFDLKPFSQRKRTRPSELIGSWKVFEVSATPVFGEEMMEKGNGIPYVYLCTETLKKRSFPESNVYFGEEEMLDIQDVTMLWLPGGVTGYVDINNDGTLCVGVGWYSDEGINLVMERDYGVDGKLKEVRWKSEVKRRWSASHPV
ncbi:Calycin-like [Quillaja saponaria]|uniref:Calycin-like n=1 Tax=Quillaja saponaria TaxID=32244 RepID=A0AAD7PPA4_QUISA|nr:Calycin-like [Quillaja saponaria]